MKNLTLEEILEEISNVIAGTCTYSTQDLTEKALDDAMYNLLFTDEVWHTPEYKKFVLEKAEEVRLNYPDLEDRINKHLAEVEQELCEHCGWWNYPGELDCCAEVDDE